MCVLDADGKPVEEYRLKREVLSGDVAVTSYSKYIIFIYGPVTCFISPANVCHTSTRARAKPAVERAQTGLLYVTI